MKASQSAISNTLYYINSIIQDVYPSDIQIVVLGDKKINSWESWAPLEVLRKQSAFGLDKPTFSLTKRLHFRTISLTDKRRKSRGWYCLPSNLEPRSNTRSLDRFISAYLIHLISFYFAINHIKYIYNIQYIYNTVADLGEGPEGPVPQLIFRPNWGPNGRNIFVGDCLPLI